jgi:hypothetical protein
MRNSPLAKALFYVFISCCSINIVSIIFKNRRQRQSFKIHKDKEEELVALLNIAGDKVNNLDLQTTTHIYHFVLIKKKLDLPFAEIQLKFIYRL